MKNIFKYIYVSDFLNSAFLLTVLTTRLVMGDLCGHEELMECAYPLRVLTDTPDLGFVSRKEELDQLCPNMNSGLRCIDSYTRRCMTEEKRDEFNRLYRSTSQVIQDLCKEGPYQEEFLRHAPCMRLAKSEYENCAKHYTKMIEDVNPAKNNRSNIPVDGNAQMRTVCCSFQDYLTCSESIVMKQCGAATANFTQGFLNRMSSSLITNHCREYLPSCLSAISGAFNSSAMHISNWLLLLILNCLFLLANARLIPYVHSACQ